MYLWLLLFVAIVLVAIAYSRNYSGGTPIDQNVLDAIKSVPFDQFPILERHIIDIKNDKQKESQSALSAATREITNMFYDLGLLPKKRMENVERVITQFDGINNVEKFYSAMLFICDKMKSTNYLSVQNMCAKLLQLALKNPKCKPVIENSAATKAALTEAAVRKLNYTVDSTTYVSDTGFANPTYSDHIVIGDVLSDALIIKYIYNRSKPKQVNVVEIYFADDPHFIINLDAITKTYSVTRKPTFI